MSVKIFCCYAHEDEALLNRLKSHLRPLQRQGSINIWYDRDIRAGAEWQKEVSKQLDEADIILLLVSASFIDSDYCYSIEMQLALKHHETGKSQVIPIILSPVLWQETPFGKLQSLPKDGRPVTNWRNRNEAFFKVAESIQEAVLKLMHETREQDPSFIKELVGEEDYKNISPYITPIFANKKHPKHFKLKRNEWQKEQYSLSDTQMDYIETKYIQIRLGNGDVVFLRRGAYSSLGDLLDELYMEYLEKDFDPFTYGKDWFLGYDQSERLYRRRYQQLILPWEWLQIGNYQTLDTAALNWQARPLEDHCLHNKLELISIIPESVLGIATNNESMYKAFIHRTKAGLAFLAYLENILQTSAKKISVSEVHVTKPDSIDIKNYKFYLILSTNQAYLNGYVFIYDELPHGNIGEW